MNNKNRYTLFRINMRPFITFILLIISLNISGQKKNPDYEAYINKYRNLAIQQQQEYKIPASITLAQGLLETGAGKSRLAVQGNNHFGIKCKDDWPGGRMYHDDDEVGECFRTYKSAEESYIDHSKFLAFRKYYVSLFKLDLYDYKAWARGLQECGYATDKAYGTKLIGIIETYELYKYDRAKIVKKQTVKDDIYEIIITPPSTKNNDDLNWRRRIYQTNGIHYVTAQTNDTYELISSDTRLKLKKLYKYNETSPYNKLKSGDIIFLQAKKKYASKGTAPHTVKSGESMHRIAQQYGMRIKSLYKLNKLKDSYVPKPGDKLKVRK